MKMNGATALRESCVSGGTTLDEPVGIEKDGGMSAAAHTGVASKEFSYLKGIWAAITGGIVVAAAMGAMGSLMWVTNASYSARQEEAYRSAIATENRLTRIEGQLGNSKADPVSNTAALEAQTKAIRVLSDVVDRLEAKVK